MIHKEPRYIILIKQFHPRHLTFYVQVLKAIPFSLQSTFRKDEALHCTAEEVEIVRKHAISINGICIVHQRIII